MLWVLSPRLGCKLAVDAQSSAPAGGSLFSFRFFFVVVFSVYDKQHSGYRQRFPGLGDFKSPRFPLASTMAVRVIELICKSSEHLSKSCPTNKKKGQNCAPPKLRIAQTLQYRASGFNVQRFEFHRRCRCHSVSPSCSTTTTITHTQPPLKAIKLPNALVIR